MRFEELNWFDVEAYLEKEDRILLVLGACEQHGYLSLLTDVRIPQALADAASQQTGVLVAPPLNFGASPYFLAYPGTISLRQETLLDVVEDIIRSLYGYGFRRMLILNGHGGNEPVRGRLYELAAKIADLKLIWYSWWSSHSVSAVAQAHELKSYHAGWIEAFPFVQTTPLPEGNKLPPKVPGLLGPEETRKLYGDGVFGGPYKVDPSILNQIWEAALQDILHFLEFTN